MRTCGCGLRTGRRRVADAVFAARRGRASPFRRPPPAAQWDLPIAGCATLKIAIGDARSPRIVLAFVSGSEAVLSESSRFVYTKKQVMRTRFLEARKTAEPY